MLTIYFGFVCYSKNNSISLKFVFQILSVSFPFSQQVNIRLREFQRRAKLIESAANQVYLLCYVVGRYLRSFVICHCEELIWACKIFFFQATWEDPWEELDPYTSHKNMEKPFKKGDHIRRDFFVSSLCWYWMPKKPERNQHCLLSRCRFLCNTHDVTKQ